MLQQIATANTDIAAFTREPAADVANLKSADDFAYMLKYQQTDNQRSAAKHQSAPIPTENKHPGPEQKTGAGDKPQDLSTGEKQPSTSKKGLEDETEASTTLTEDTNDLVETTKDSQSQANSQNDDESVKVVEENQWLLLMEKLVNDALDSRSQTPDTAGHDLTSVNKQLNDSGEGIDADIAEAQSTLAAMLSDVFSTQPKDAQAAGEIEGEIHNLLQQNPQISEAFAQLLELHKQAAGGEQGVLPPQEQQLLEALLSEAIVATADMQNSSAKEPSTSVIAPDEATTDGTTPDGTTPDGTTPDGTTPDVTLATQGQVALEPTLDSQTLAVLPDASLTQIIQLPKDKLDKVLAYLEQKLSAADITAKIAHSASVSEQQAASLGLDNILDKTAGVSDFVAALKTGIAEVKAQLSQGREPGIDLKGLVNEALKATGEPGQSGVVKVPEQLDPTLKAFNQTLEFAQQLSSALDQSSQLNVANNSFREVGQLQGEQVKSSQLHTSQLDKTLNLVKPEAHQQLVEKVRWMVNSSQLVAEIRLDPAELGSMHVKVSLAGESANVSFVVNSAQAKEAVDNATPKLREMLAEKGIELGQSSVEQESKNQGQEQQMAGDGQHSGQEELDEGAVHDQVIQQPIVNGALGGIDYFV